MSEPEQFNLEYQILANTSFRNLLLNKLKSQGVIVSGEHITEELSTSSELRIIGKEEELALNTRLKKASAYLTARQNEAIFLRFYEELSYEEVAEIMSITVKTTYKIMARALSELKEKYVHLFILLWSLSYLLS